MSSASPASEPLIRPLEVLVGVVIAGVLVGPALAAGGLAGSGGAEVYGHAWVQWWAGLAWPAWPVGTALVEGAQPWAIIDPLPTWLAAGLGRLVGPTLAWNAWIAAGIVLAAVGGGAFARALGGNGVVGAVGVATMPIFLGSLTSGLTEDAALGLVALALAALLRGRRLLGGALLGLCAWFGLYLAWLGALAALGIGLWRLRRDGLRTLPAWALAGLVTLAVASPAALPFRDRLAGVGHRAGTFEARPEPRWRLDPWRGADLASFGAPGKVDVEGAFVREHPVYLGYTTLGLAALGGWHPAWLGVLACAAVAPGEQLSWAGQPLGANNPAITAFRLLPFADRFNHHARVMLLGQLLLVGLSARGAGRLALLIQRFRKIEPEGQPEPTAGAVDGALRPGSRGGPPLGGGPRGAPGRGSWAPAAAPGGGGGADPRAQRPARGGEAPPGPPGTRLDWALPLGCAALVFLETTLASPARVPLPVASAATPAIYTALTCFPEALPVVVVGAAGPGVHPQRVFFDQRAHGRRLLHNPNRPSDGRPRADAVVVALGDAVARVTAQRGPPEVTAADGAAWGPVDRARFEAYGCAGPEGLED